MVYSLMTMFKIVDFGYEVLNWHFCSKLDIFIIDVYICSSVLMKDNFIECVSRKTEFLWALK